MRSLSITKQFVFEDFKEMAQDLEDMMMQMRAWIVYYNFFHKRNSPSKLKFTLDFYIIWFLE